MNYFVAADEAEMARDSAAIEGDIDQDADPSDMFAAEMAGRKGQIAEAIKDRPAVIDFDRQQIVRPMAHDHIGARIDRRVRDIGHVLQRIAPKPPMAGGNDDVGLRAERRDVFRNSSR